MSTGTGETNGNLPRLLDEDATPEEIVKAVNGLAYEIQLVRLAVREQGVRTATLILLIERALDLKAGK